MFGSTVLEIAIGIAFVYLLVSLIITAANELIASLLKWRAKTLKRGIAKLLEDPNFAEQLYNHPLIQGLGTIPSYIPSHTFALAVLDLVAKNADGGAQTLADIRAAISGSPVKNGVKDALLVLVDGAANDVRTAVSEFTKAKESVELWFNNSMDRVGGWYKRKVQVVLFSLSVLFTVALNVDTILIARTLSTDAVLRTAIVEQAKKIAEQPPAGAQGAQPGAGATEAQQQDEEIIAETKKAKQQFVKTITNLQESGVPVGWKAEKNIPDLAENPEWWLLKLLGLIFTAAAASLGAPFWFDVLSKFISVRSTGKVPEAPKAPPEG